MRLALVIDSLRAGGAERVMSIMADYWAGHGNLVTLLTIEKKETDFYSLDDAVTRVGLDCAQESGCLIKAVRHNWRRLRILRRTLVALDPDVVISFMDKTNILTLLATTGTGLPVIVSEHIDPRQSPLKGIWNLLKKITYRWASSVVVLTEELKTVMGRVVPPEKVYVIPNPAIIIEGDDATGESQSYPAPYIVAMGRLIKQKGFDYLLEAFARCGHPGWSLVILGEGRDRGELESLAGRLNIRERVFMPGIVRNPGNIMRRGNMFVLSSRFEGFPMALVEAMSCGLPVVSFDCPTGPSDIIKPGEDGVLVSPENVDELGEAMSKLMDDQGERKRLAKNAQNVVERFSIGKVGEKWEKVFSESVGAK